MKEGNDCKRLLDESEEEKPAAESFENEIRKLKSCSSLPEAVLYKNGVWVALRRQMTTSLSQNVFFSSQEVLKHLGHLVATLHERVTEKRLRKRMMGLAKRELWWSSEGVDLPRSFSGLVQIY